MHAAQGCSAWPDRDLLRVVEDGRPAKPPAAAPITAGTTVALFACASSRAVLHHVETALAPRSLLSPAELGRAGALARPRDQEDFIAARALVRLLLRRGLVPESGLTSLTDFTLAQQCPWCGGPHGRPVVDIPGVGVSWAHSGGYVAAAIGPGAVGVDVEPALTEAGHLPASATTRSWVRSEAIVKWGHGDLDEAPAWQAHLQGRVSRRGRRYSFAVDGSPRPARVPWGRGGGGVVLTDAPEGDLPVVCSVAAASRAHWLDVLPPDAREQQDPPGGRGSGTDEARQLGVAGSAGSCGWKSQALSS